MESTIFIRALLATTMLAMSAQLDSAANGYIHTILVTGENDSCKEEGNMTHCGNLSGVCAWTVRSSTAILLKSHHTPLNTVISFVGLAHIAIIGVAESNTIVSVSRNMQEK